MPRQTLYVRRVNKKDNEENLPMTILNRRNFMKTAAAASALPLLGRAPWPTNR